LGCFVCLPSLALRALLDGLGIGTPFHRALLDGLGTGTPFHRALLDGLGIGIPFHRALLDGLKIGTLNGAGSGSDRRHL
jgi:hypothetical protein